MATIIQLLLELREVVLLHTQQELEATTRCSSVYQIKVTEITMQLSVMTSHFTRGTKIIIIGCDHSNKWFLLGAATQIINWAYFKIPMSKLLKLTNRISLKSCFNTLI